MAKAPYLEKKRQNEIIKVIMDSVEGIENLSLLAAHIHIPVSYHV